MDDSSLPAAADRMFSFEATLSPGVNRFELHFWKWATGQGQRPMAILVTGITVAPSGGSGVMIETKQGVRVVRAG